MTTTGQQTAATAAATAATPTLAEEDAPAADNTAALAGTAAPSEVPESHLNDGDDKDTAEMDTDVVEETPPETATAATARAKAAMTAFQKAMRDFSEGTAKCQSLVTSAAAQLVLEDNVPSDVAAGFKHDAHATPDDATPDASADEKEDIPKASTSTYCLVLLNQRTSKAVQR